MKQLVIGCSFLLAIVCCNVAHAAEVDTRPLDVKIVPAFPRLEWPAWLTGADRGQSGEVLPVVITGARDGTNRLFIASQHGTIHVMPNNRQADSVTTFLDIRDRVIYNPNKTKKDSSAWHFIHGMQRMANSTSTTQKSRLATNLMSRSSRDLWFPKTIPSRQIPKARKYCSVFVNLSGITMVARWSLDPKATCISVWATGGPLTTHT